MTATLRTDAVSAQMTAKLFCEGSVRDKQIAQESSDHKDGRTEPETMPLDNGSAAKACIKLVEVITLEPYKNNFSCWSSFFGG